jgi:hypothetical protein
MTLWGLEETPITVLGGADEHAARQIASGASAKANHRARIVPNSTGQGVPPHHRNSERPRKWSLQQRVLRDDS